MAAPKSRLACGQWITVHFFELCLCSQSNAGAKAEQELNFANCVLPQNPWNHNTNYNGRKRRGEEKLKQGTVWLSAGSSDVLTLVLTGCKLILNQTLVEPRLLLLRVTECSNDRVYGVCGGPFFVFRETKAGVYIFISQYRACLVPANLKSRKS